MKHKRYEIDDGLGDPEPRFVQGSRTWRIAQLSVGESYVEGVRISKKDMPTFERSASFKSLESPIHASVQRASSKLGNKYDVERATSVLTSGDVMIFVVVTRVT